MSLLDSAVKEKVRPALTSIVNMFFGQEKKSKSSEPLNVFDKFSKNKLEDIIVTPVNKKVWVNGQEFVVMATCQQDLDLKIKKMNQERLALELNQTGIIEKPLFSNLYTKIQTTQKNEWSEKRDVWINEYCPN